MCVSVILFMIKVPSLALSWWVELVIPVGTRLGYNEHLGVQFRLVAKFYFGFR